MKEYQFHTSCVHSTAELIDDMCEHAVEITYETMLRHCDLPSWAKQMLYEKRKDQGLTLKGDWHVTYHKSRYGGVSCYYLVHSAIEHIWVAEEPGSRPGSMRRDHEGKNEEHQDPH